MKTSELTGAALAWFVWKAEGVIEREFPGSTFQDWMEYAKLDRGGAIPLEWSTCGPIIERERITLLNEDSVDWEGVADWETCTGERACCTGQFGPTPLIAAMRAYVASKFGAEVPDA